MNILKKFPKLFFIVKKIYALLFKKRKVTYWINMILSNKQKFIIQIGSNDGKTGDPLHHLIKINKNWTALFVEPVPFLFERLKKNYGEEKRFYYENVAINNGIEQNFYWVDNSAKENVNNLPNWFDQLNSFNREHIVKHLGNNIIPYIKSVKIKGITLEKLISKYSNFKLDMLHIDTEGYDWEVLSQLNLEKYTPTIILYERIHLSEKDKSLSTEYLSKYYKIFSFQGDFFCVDKNHEIFKKELPVLLKNRLEN